MALTNKISDPSFSMDAISISKRLIILSQKGKQPSPTPARELTPAVEETDIPKLADGETIDEKESDKTPDGTHEESDKTPDGTPDTPAFDGTPDGTPDGKEE